MLLADPAVVPAVGGLRDLSRSLLPLILLSSALQSRRLHRAILVMCRQAQGRACSSSASCLHGASGGALLPATCRQHRAAHDRDQAAVTSRAPSSPRSSASWAISTVAGLCDALRRSDARRAPSRTRTCFRPFSILPALFLHPGRACSAQAHMAVAAAALLIDRSPACSSPSRAAHGSTSCWRRS